MKKTLSFKSHAPSPLRDTLKLDQIFPTQHIYSTKNRIGKQIRIDTSSSSSQVEDAAMTSYLKILNLTIQKIKIRKT